MAPLLVAEAHKVCLSGWASLKDVPSFGLRQGIGTLALLAA